MRSLFIYCAVRSVYNEKPFLKVYKVGYIHAIASLLCHIFGGRDCSH